MSNISSTRVFSELYRPNGAGQGYNKLNQLTAFRRGVLSDSNSDGIPDTVSSPSRTQEWLFDPNRIGPDIEIKR